MSVTGQKLLMQQYSIFSNFLLQCCHKTSCKFQLIRDRCCIIQQSESARTNIQRWSLLPNYRNINSLTLPWFREFWWISLTGKFQTYFQGFSWCNRDTTTTEPVLAQNIPFPGNDAVPYAISKAIKKLQNLTKAELNVNHSRPPSFVHNPGMNKQLSAYKISKTHGISQTV